jgi:hypothetical protein
VALANKSRAELEALLGTNEGRELYAFLNSTETVKKKIT